jgi:hypothetical protein
MTANAFPYCRTQPGSSRGSGSDGAAGNGGRTGDRGGSVTVGTITSGTGAGGVGSAVTATSTGGVGGSVVAGDVGGIDTGARGPEGCAGRGVAGGRCATGVRAFASPRRRSGPGEACGRLCSGPDTATSCGTRTTGAAWMRSGPRAKGEAGPRIVT